MIAFDRYNYCVFFGVKFPIYPVNWATSLESGDFSFELVFHRYSKQLHRLPKVPNEYLLYRLSSQSQKPNPVYHFFPKISLSFSCFLLRIPYTILRKSNKNLKSDFLSFCLFLMDRQAIYEYLTKIPYGKVTTYKHIAQKFWIHPRVVGMIMRSNDHPDKYPCCKVVWADGKLTGYALGLEEKIRKLATEGIPVQNNRVPLEYLWTWVEEKKTRF